MGTSTSYGWRIANAQHFLLEGLPNGMPYLDRAFRASSLLGLLRFETTQGLIAEDDMSPGAAPASLTCRLHALGSETQTLRELLSEIRVFATWTTYLTKLREGDRPTVQITLGTLACSQVGSSLQFLLELFLVDLSSRRHREAALDHYL